MFKKTLFLCAISLFFLVNPSASANTIEFETTIQDKNIERLYYSLNRRGYNPPQLNVYKKALKGFFKYKSNRRILGNTITMIDYSLPSTKKRLWVIDFNSNTILLNCLVAHGKNSGGLTPSDFSNQMESHKSCLGSFCTGESYDGSNGLSMRLDGLQENLNDNARDRDIVMHGAEYVSESFIFEKGFLGRSYGCPAVPAEYNEKIITLIKEHNFLYIYHPSIDN